MDLFLFVKIWGSWLKRCSCHYEWNTNSRLATILRVTGGKEAAQSGFFIRNSVIEEFPCSPCVSEQTDRVSQQDLRANTPPKPPEVGRMTQVTIHAGRD